MFCYKKKKKKRCIYDCFSIDLYFWNTTTTSTFFFLIPIPIPILILWNHFPWLNEQTGEKLKKQFIGELVKFSLNSRKFRKQQKPTTIWEVALLLEDWWCLGITAKKDTGSNSIHFEFWILILNFEFWFWILIWFWFELIWFDWFDLNWFDLIDLIDLIWLIWFDSIDSIDLIWFDSIDLIDLIWVNCCYDFLFDLYCLNTNVQMLWINLIHF